MLRKSTGNMYEFVTHTWNPIKGECPHECIYCYMRRWGKQKPLHLDEKELKTNLGTGNFIFVGSSTDMFAYGVEAWMIKEVLSVMSKYDNKYLLQSKNPEAFMSFLQYIPTETALCTTIETNRWYEVIMEHAPHPWDRVIGMSPRSIKGFERYVTIEPIMDFDLPLLIQMIQECYPKQVNIGADSGNNNLPEPSSKKTLELIDALSEFTTVKLKKNLNRIIGRETK